MSTPPQMRRADKAMPAALTLETLQKGFCGRVAVLGEDGYPYCVPMLYVWLDGEVFLHSAKARGQLRTNVEHESRVCFEVDEPGEIFPYGRFECDTSVAFRSVILFGRIRIVEETDAKQRFFEALMQKYGKPEWDRPKGFFPRLDQITLYAIAVERITGKEGPLPDCSMQWPALDRTRTPNARL
ncbi:MAG TPA: pyridoxamine 5'-phosphate oxidase family protein [Rhizomicrobium sp.]|nr:pyridoxamine 5'-phosphate oxidase family protein [Rhizomicrobium sp.]